MASCLIIITSCEKVLDIEIEQEEVTVIVNSALTPGQIVDFKIYNSVPVSTYNFENIEEVDGATIILYENDTPVDEIQQNSYGYQSTYLPKEGKNYRFELTLPNSGPLSGQSYIPEAVPILLTTANFESSTNNVRVGITFSDPMETDNYYIFTLSTLYLQNDGTYEPFDFGHPWLYGASDFSVVEKNIFPNGQRGLLFSDNMINGKDYELIITMWDYSIIGSSPKKTCKICFQLTSISKEMYLYAKSFAEQGGGGINPFNEYFNVYSNIENGLGIFGGYSTAYDTLLYRWGD